MRTNTPKAWIFIFAVMCCAYFAHAAPIDTTAARRSAAFYQHLKEMGLPVVGVSGSGPTCRIDFDGTETAGQRTAANSERASFDWTKAAADSADVATGANIDKSDKQIRALSAALVVVLSAHDVKVTAEEMKTAYDAEYKKLSN